MRDSKFFCATAYLGLLMYNTSKFQIFKWTMRLFQFLVSISVTIGLSMCLVAVIIFVIYIRYFKNGKIIMFILSIIIIELILKLMVAP